MSPSTSETTAVPFFARFRTRLLLLILLVILPALALTVQTNLKQRQTEKARIRESTVGFARLLAANEQNFVKNTRQLLATLSPISFLVRSTNRPFTQIHFINLRILSPDYLDFGLIESNGTLFCSAALTNSTADLSHRSHFQRVLRTRHFSIGDLQKDQFTAKPSLDFGFPVLDSQGRLARVLYASLNLALLSEVAAQTDLPTNATATLIDTRGNVLARHPDAAAWIGKPLLNEPFVQRILKGGPGVFEMEGLDGIDRLFAVAPIGDGYESRLYATVGIPKTLVFAGANRALLNSILLLVVVAALALLLARFYATQSLLGPVDSLVSAARRLARGGESTVRTGLAEGKGELSEVGRAFDEMAATIERRRKEIAAADAEVKRVNAELEQRVKDRTARLEEVNRELEAFSYSVSHDLRAPLRHIAGYAHLLAQNRESQLSDQAKRHLGMVSDSVKRMGRLIDDLLHFSRMGRGELRQVEWDMNALVQEAVQEVSSAARDRQIQWSISELPRVVADRAMLRQVWVNLISNAVKYSAGRDPALISIGVERGEKEFVFHIQDNGAGFEMQYAHKLFGVFQRLHDEDQFEGTGIGLANVRRIIYRHGGRTWAEGEPGKGATFYFSLPVPVEAAAQEKNGKEELPLA